MFSSRNYNWMINIFMYWIDSSGHSATMRFIVGLSVLQFHPGKKIMFNLQRKCAQLPWSVVILLRMIQVLTIYQSLVELHGMVVKPALGPTFEDCIRFSPVLVGEFLEPRRFVLVSEVSPYTGSCALFTIFRNFLSKDFWFPLYSA